MVSRSSFLFLQSLGARPRTLLDPLDALLRDAIGVVHGLEDVLKRRDFGLDHVLLERRADRNELECRVGDDDAVPLARRGAGQEALTFGFREVGFVRNENSGGRIELQELAARLGETVAGHYHHDLGDEAEPLLLHHRSRHGECLSRADGMGDVGRAGRDDTPDGALLVAVEGDDRAGAGKLEMGSVEVPRDEIIEPLVVDFGEPVGAGRVYPYPVLEGEFDGSELVLRRLGLAGVQLAAFVAVLAAGSQICGAGALSASSSSSPAWRRPVPQVVRAIGVAGEGGDVD